MSDDAGAGAEGTTAPEGGAEGAEAGEITGPEGQNWWQFGSKTDAEEWANNLVTKRLSRERKTKLDPIAQERDTLRAEVERLKPLEDATKTDFQRLEEKLNSQASELEQLRGYRSQQERTNLVRSIAEELGLPSHFTPRVRGDNEDAIREDVQDLLNVLSEGGSNTGKKTPPSKAPKPENSGGGSVSSGGGSSSDTTSDDDLIKSIVEQTNQERRNGGLLVTRRR